MSTDYQELARMKIHNVELDRDNYEGLSQDMAKYIQDEIIAMRSAKHAYTFARDVPGAAKDVLQNIVLHSTDPNYAYGFAKFVKDADIEALQQVIIDSGNGHAAALFASYVKGADVKALQKIVLEHGDAADAYMLAKSGKDVDIKSLQRKVLEGTDGHIACEFAQYVHGANVLELQKITEKYGSSFDIIHFAQYITGANVKELQDTLLKNAAYPHEIYTFVKDVPAADVAAAHRRLYEMDEAGDPTALSVIVEFHGNKELMARLASQSKPADPKPAEPTVGNIDVGANAFLRSYGRADGVPAKQDEKCGTRLKM